MIWNSLFGSMYGESPYIVLATGWSIIYNDYNLQTDYIVTNKITVDNDLQIVTGVYTIGGLPIPNVLSKFTSKNWFRLRPKQNDIAIYGSLNYYEISFTERLKIGG